MITKKATLLVGTFAIAGLCLAQVPKKALPKLSNQTDSVSYALGYLEAQQYLQQFSHDGFPFDTLNVSLLAKSFAKSNVQESYVKYRKEQFDTLSIAIYKQGFINQLTYNGNGIFTDSIADNVLRNKFNAVRQRAEEAKQKEMAQFAENEKTFLAQNKLRDGVHTTPSGLQYEIIKAGEGSIPSMDSNVKCHYIGTLTNGTVFDSSIERGEPIDFNLNSVIKGWTEALQMMPVGSKWKLFIPSELGYGDRGAGDVIPPHSTLVFELELLQIN